MLLFHAHFEAYPCACSFTSKEIYMKHLLSMLAVVFTLGLSTAAMDADAAKRMGGKS